MNLSNSYTTPIWETEDYKLLCVTARKVAKDALDVPCYGIINNKTLMVEHEGFVLPQMIEIIEKIQLELNNAQKRIGKRRILDVTPEMDLSKLKG